MPWDDDVEAGASHAQGECPVCGEAVELVIDPTGGAVQEYVEDCPVCCAPWQVTVHVGLDGVVEDVQLESAQ